jgi:hypothetical protein
MSCLIIQLPNSIIRKKNGYYVAGFMLDLTQILEDSIFSSKVIQLTNQSLVKLSMLSVVNFFVIL